MAKMQLIDKASAFVENSADNYLAKPLALSERVVGLKIFESPIFACAAANDNYFTKLKDPAIVGEHFLLPQEWLPGAKTVISFFLPFTEAVKGSNKVEKVWPSEGWLHGRIEGQALINKLCQYLQDELAIAGYTSVVPALDERFWSRTGFGKDSTKKDGGQQLFTSNWSERHVAYVCGLGTFGLSKGLITKKGMAGRLGSIITELQLTPDERAYTRYNEYCSMCGACLQNCPVSAITLEEGKNHVICSEFLDRTMDRYKPRYGCGKCQIKVPCESGIPRL